ncbi:MAG TPA: gliding motility protein GldL [Bacteroidetes bacterium]|nr:gliding motility protein GldL [Bacteroidota bacterium]
MSFVHTNWFKYVKNFIIGVAAAIVMLGALGKLTSKSWGNLAITVGLGTEAFIFAFLGIIGPEKDYYWEKLYPGLDKAKSKMIPLTQGGDSEFKPLHGDVIEAKLGGMLEELQAMSKSLGSLKALQEIDFTETAENAKSMHNFYKKINEAMSTLSETAEDTAKYKEHMASLNKNLEQLNGVYGNVLSAFQVRS